MKTYGYRSDNRAKAQRQQWWASLSPSQREAYVERKLDQKTWERLKNRAPLELQILLDKARTLGIQVQED